MINSAVKVRFARASKESFRSTLTERVKEYFKQNDISSKANTKMVVKTITLLVFYFTPLVLLLTMSPGPLGVIGLYLLMGVGMSGVGMGVMHDAVHGAYHANRMVNKILGASMYLISGNVATWKIQHNILHHTYTNIDGLDDDLETGGLIRLHPDQEWKWFHKFQVWYAPFLYGLLTLNWVVAKDFKQLVRYYKEGHAGRDERNIGNEWVILVITKMIYFGLFLALPIILVPAAWYWVVLGFVLMHFLAGVILSFVFQLAHMVEGVDNIQAPADGKIEDEWMVHQLRTTADFSRDSKLINWFFGGLNFQVEHHLFPTICHVHYPALSEIVKQTAAEYDLPYRENLKIGKAIKAHMVHLRNLSQP